MSVGDDAHFQYALIVETDQYTGNFERQLCAYATSSYGDCDVGKELAELAVQDFINLGLDEYAVSSFTAPWVKDEHGCGRPVSIWNAAGNSGYNDLAIFLDYPFSPKIFELVKYRIEEFAEKSRANVGTPTDYGPKFHTQIRAGDLHIKKMYMIKRTITIVDEPQDPIEQPA